MMACLMELGRRLMMLVRRKQFGRGLGRRDAVAPELREQERSRQVLRLKKGGMLRADNSGTTSLCERRAGRCGDGAGWKTHCRIRATVCGCWSRLRHLPPWRF